MPEPVTPSPDAGAPDAGARRTVARTTLLRVVGHALWIGPVVTAVLLAALVMVIAETDHDHDLDSVVAQLWMVAVVLVVGLPVSLACSAAAGLVAGAVARPLRETRVPLGVQAVLGGLGAVVVVGTTLTLLWDLVRSAGVFAVMVALACLATGALAVLVAGRAPRPALAGPDDAADVRRRRRAPWVATASAVALTGALVGVGFWWFHVATDLSDSSYADPGVDPGLALPPAPSTPPLAPREQPEPPEPPSTAQVRTELDTLRLEALTAGGDALPWQEPLAVAEASCTTDAGAPGTVLTLTGRFSTRDLATASDNVDFLLITQDNEKVAARIVDAWTDGHEETADMMKGEYWLVPPGTATIGEAHVGFDEGVGEVRVTTLCAVG